MTALGPVVPILRIFDVAKAQEFYIDFLSFTLKFEHRFGDDFPLYMGVSRDGCELHLSEHHGDASPGSHVRIEAADIVGLASELAAKQYRYARPGAPEVKPWGTLELTITDPFGNRLTFVESTAMA